MARSLSLFVLPALALAAISALLRAQAPALLLAEADTHLSAEAVAKADTFTRRSFSEGGQMLTSGVEPAQLPLLPNPGAGALLAGCRQWQGQALGASSGSAVFDSCSLGAVSITEQQPLNSYVTDDYFLAFADMCGDGEIITQINAAPANGGWAGLEVREDTASP